MNCRDFTERMNDLARGALMDAGARAETLAHEGDCAACAARLADDRSLASALRALAARDAALEAPPRAEAALLAAFRARHAAAAHADAVTPPTGERVGEGAAGRPASAPAVARHGINIAPPAAHAPRGRRTWAKTLATAASVAAAAVVTLFALAPTDEPAAPTERATTVAPNASVRPADEAALDVSQTATALPPSAAETGAAAGTGGEPLAGLAPRAATPPSVAPARRTARRPQAIPAGYDRGGASADPQAGRSAPAARGEDEIATDFIALTEDAREVASAGGHLVRVELPRSALVRFGLPMNVERAAERVKADVMLGEDGIARAIRFVR